MSAQDPAGPSKLTSPPATPPLSRLSSEDLEAFEDAAVAEMAHSDEEYEAEVDRLYEMTALRYPPERIATYRKEVRRLGVNAFIQQYVKPVTSILHLLCAFGVFLPHALRQTHISRDVLLQILQAALQRIVYTREKLPQYNTVSDALSLLREAKSNSIVVLSGAGISTSCGIPDFRSEDGIYARLKRRNEFSLDDPTDMFDKEVFLSRPEVFYSFAKEIYPSNFKPSHAHRFIKLLQDQGRLLRNYTQNIDTLEQAAGITKVLNCHGSFATASCVTCGFKTQGADIKEDIFAERVPLCPKCNDATHRPKKRKRQPSTAQADTDDDEDDDGLRKGIMKPDIVFFGEKLSDEFDHALLADRDQSSLLIVIGSSLSVAPVSKVVGHLPHSTPTILINRTPVRDRGLDIVLLGDADYIVQWLSNRLGWTIPTPQPDKTVVGESSAAAAAGTSTPVKDNFATYEPVRVGTSHIWLFPKAQYAPPDEDDDQSYSEAELSEPSNAEGNSKCSDPPSASKSEMLSADDGQ